MNATVNNLRAVQVCLLMILVLTLCAAQATPPELPQKNERMTVKATLIAKTVFFPSPARGTAVLAACFTASADGRQVLSTHSYMTRGDTVDVAYRRFSSDGGHTWSDAQEIITGEKRPEGMFRRHLRAAYCDPNTGRFIFFRTDGILPNDNPLEGMKQWELFYTVSEDGGKTYCVDEQIIQDGAEYNAQHPLPDVWHGKNSAQLGDLGSAPLTLPDGTILLPVQVTPIGPNGEYYNPGGGYTYHDCMVLRGRWREDKRIAWEASTRVVADPKRTTRGLIEPTLGILDDGRLLMVMRASNDRRPSRPCYRWAAFSSDCGKTWSKPVPWTYSDGTAFFSPSSCSQLLQHSSGALFWIGNISPKNPTGNSPRYPLIIGEVDKASGLLIRDSVSVIATREPGDDERMTLSNFYAREDPATHEIHLYMTPLFAKKYGDWTADAYLYRIAVQ